MGEPITKAPSVGTGWMLAGASAVVLTFYSNHSHFLPSNRWAVAAIYATVALAMLVYVLAIDSSSFNYTNPRYPRCSNRWTHALLPSLFFLFFGYDAISITIAQAANFVVGTEVTEDIPIIRYAVIQTKYRFCAGPVIENYFGPLCNLPYPRDQLRRGTVLRLNGRKSWLGIDVASATVARQAADAKVPHIDPNTPPPTTSISRFPDSR